MSHASLFVARPLLMADRVLYGGQAVLEGVMMRGRRAMAVAVRAPGGQIVVRSEELPARVYGGWVSRTPFVRGLTLLWDTLGLGMKALMFSVDVATEGEKAEMSRPVTWTSVLPALAFGIGIFFVLPVLAAGLAERLFQSDWIGHAVEGLVRLILFIGYVAAIGLFPDIRRVYAYHGAEHMTIHAYEADDSIEPGAVAKYPPAHPRCGTAFLILIVALSVVVFALVGTPDLPARIASRIVLIPVIAGIAYEVLKLGGAHPDHPIMRAIIAPGLLVQALTTRRPDGSQIEVAIAAFNEMRRREAEPAGA